MTIREFLARVWHMLVGRSIGPMKLCPIFQLTVAAIFAIRAGLRDAHEGRTPFFFWSVFTNRARRPELLRQVWKDVGNVSGVWEADSKAFRPLEPEV